MNFRINIFWSKVFFCAVSIVQGRMHERRGFHARRDSQCMQRPTLQTIKIIIHWILFFQSIFRHSTGPHQAKAAKQVYYNVSNLLNYAADWAQFRRADKQPSSQFRKVWYYGRFRPNDLHPLSKIVLQMDLDTSHCPILENTSVHWAPHSNAGEGDSNQYPTHSHTQ